MDAWGCGFKIYGLDVLFKFSVCDMGVVYS